MSLRSHNQKKRTMKGTHNIGFKITGVKVLQTITKPNIQYTLTNYSGELAVKSYRDDLN